VPTLLDKIWDNHLVRSEKGRPDLIYIDRHLVHEVTSPQAFSAMRRDGRKVRRPDLTWAVCDHVVPTTHMARPLADEVAETQMAALEQNATDFGIPYFGWGQDRQGVIHVTMPEQGIVLPGNTVVAGDSHTATHGAFGALAFGIGTSEVEHVLATQTLPQSKPPCMAVEVKGDLPAGCTAKDVILAIIGQLGNDGATGYAVEYMGPAIKALSMEGRMTLCNMSIEAGARSGMVAPDQTTFAWLKGRPYAPQGEDWDRAVAYWKTLPSDPDAKFDKRVVVDISAMEPMLTWGVNPGQVAGIGGLVPEPASLPSERQKAAADALDYIGLKPGQKFSEVPIDYAFIGSCTNGRLEDLRAAAAVAKGRKVAQGVTAIVVPGSMQVKAQAEAEGLDKIFSEAGFEWRLPGCSMCLAMNPDVLPEGNRCASTSNRNFKGRQGKGGRTHLCSPAMAAASAINGRLSDPREFI